MNQRAATDKVPLNLMLLETLHCGTILLEDGKKLFRTGLGDGRLDRGERILQTYFIIGIKKKKKTLKY